MTASKISGSTKEFGTAHQIHPEARAWLENTVGAAAFPFVVEFNFWDSDLVKVGRGTRTLTLNVRHPGVLARLSETQEPLNLAEELVDGEVTFKGTVDDLVRLYCYLAQNQLDPSDQLRAWCGTLPATKGLSEANADWDKLASGSKERDRAVVQYHYDVGNDFYKLWLDPDMLYSCAHFEREDMTLAEAQKAKIDLICRKLRLKAGEHMLDIGCGWGALLRHAVTNYGVTAHGITLSEEQFAYNQSEIKRLGLEGQLKVELLDYRDLPQEPTYDKISSVGMVEHVGIFNFPDYYGAAHRSLKPGGLFLNHGITCNRLVLPQVDFILRYIFPDAHTPHLTAFLEGARDAGFEIIDVDCWRPHYAKTLRAWAANLDARLDEAYKIMGNRLIIWRIYLIMCAQYFEDGSNSVWQTMLRREEDGEWNLPFTRGGWLA
jgi:cyclopropane-fatty-acyl-phospholipid synthase